MLTGARGSLATTSRRCWRPSSRRSRTGRRCRPRRRRRSDGCCAAASRRIRASVSAPSPTRDWSWKRATAVAAVATSAFDEPAGSVHRGSPGSSSPLWSSRPQRHGELELEPGAGSSKPGAVTSPIRLTISLPTGDEVTDTNHLPLAISPDGSRIAYVGLRDGSRQLFLRNLGRRRFRPARRHRRGAHAVLLTRRPVDRFLHQHAVEETRGRERRGSKRHRQFPPSRGAACGPPTGRSTTRRTTSRRCGKSLPLAALRLKRRSWTRRAARSATAGRRSSPMVRCCFRRGPAPAPTSTPSSITILRPASGVVLTTIGDTPRFVPTGHLVYARLDALFAVPWRDLPRGSTTPRRSPCRNCHGSRTKGQPTMSCRPTAPWPTSPVGRRVIRSGVVWVDRGGIVEPLPLPGTDYEAVALSPDAQRAVLQIREGTIGLWLYDFARRTLTPFATASGSSQGAVWTPDGRRIVYRGTRQGTRNLYWKPTDGSGDEERLTTKPGVVHTPSSVSPDGQWLAFAEGGGTVQGTTWVMSLTGDRTPRVFIDGGVSAAVLARRQVDRVSVRGVREPRSLHGAVPRAGSAHSGVGRRRRQPHLVTRRQRAVLHQGATGSWPSASPAAPRCQSARRACCSKAASRQPEHRHARSTFLPTAAASSGSSRRSPTAP